MFVLQKLQKQKESVRKIIIFDNPGAWFELYVFPPLASVACFTAPGTGYTITRALHARSSVEERDTTLTNDDKGRQHCTNQISQQYK